MLLTTVSILFVVVVVLAVTMSVRAIQAYSGTTRLRAYNGNSVDIQMDTADHLLKYKDDAGTVQVVPTQAVPAVSAAGYIQVAVVNLDGATWHTGNGTADYLSWTVPANCVITRLIVNTTTKSTGAATADIGYTATDNHTNADNLIDAIDIGTGVICQGNILPGPAGVTVDTELACLAAASGKWVTFHALADPTGLVGKAYIHYFTL